MHLLTSASVDLFDSTMVIRAASAAVVSLIIDDDDDDKKDKHQVVSPARVDQLEK
jgi:hypothetical protein